LSVLSHGACGCFVHWRLGPSASPPHCCIAGRLLHLMAPVGPCTLLLFACVVSRCFGLPWFAIAALASHCPCMLGLRCVGWMLIVPRLRSASRGSSTLWRFRPSFGNNPEHPEVAISVCQCGAARNTICGVRSRPQEREVRHLRDLGEAAFASLEREVERTGVHPSALIELTFIVLGVVPPWLCTRRSRSPSCSRPRPKPRNVDERASCTRRSSSA
jgi:hypothetical protein